jgi:uncharacterized protein YndB with AHSA1/START domain
VIEWRIHLSSSPERVYEFLSTAEGRAAFWAESAPERDGHIEFTFPGGLEWRGQILEAVPPRVFSVRYYGDTEARFVLEAAAGGCDVLLTDTADDAETRSGWVSVLLALRLRPTTGSICATTIRREHGKPATRTTDQLRWPGSLQLGGL